MTLRVYLAGPDVFLPDAEARAAAKRLICAECGLLGISPLDAHDDPPEWATLAEWQQIGLRNEAHIRAADAIIADLTPFRGPSADPGTVYEVGFGRALGRPIFAYSSDPALFLARTLAWLGPGSWHDGDGWRDQDRMAVEAFGCRDNLMIETGIVASGGTLLAASAPSLELFRQCAMTAASALAGGGPVMGSAGVLRGVGKGGEGAVLVQAGM
jgi:nucleoside 2-deoxyribosyltransferase